MVSKKELRSIRRFVCDELRVGPDLSTLTVGILKRRYMALGQRQALSPEAKRFMKQVVQVELMKMQDNEKIQSEPETKKLQNKRKRGKENDEVISRGDESMAKKSRYQSSSSSDSDDEDEDCNTQGEEGEEEEEEEKQAKSGSEDEEQEVKKVNGKHQTNNEESNESEKDGEESDCGSGPEEMVKNGESTTEGGERGSSNTSQGKKKKQSDPETKKLLNKRKRGKENDEVISRGDESMAKKSHYQSSSSSDSDDEDEDCNTQGEEGEEEEEEEKQAKAKSGYEDEEQEQEVKKVNGKHQMNNEESNESEKDGEESDCGSGPEEMVKNGESTTEGGERGSSNTGQGKKKTQSDLENKGDTDRTSEGSDQINDDSTGDSETEQKVSVGKRLPLDDEKEGGTKAEQDNKKKKVKKAKSTDGQKDTKAVVRLKRYIALCGVRRNYKKLLDGCRSVGAEVAVLKKELVDLGVHGPPSVQKCKKVREKREEDLEIAELDVNNIIATEGRPRRRAAWQEPPEPRCPKYVSSVNSGSDSDEDNRPTHRGHRRAANWANLKGIISDDADSD